MVGIDLKVSRHHLKIDLKAALHRKKESSQLKRYEALKEEV